MKNSEDMNWIIKEPKKGICQSCQSNKWIAPTTAIGSPNTVDFNQPFDSSKTFEMWLCLPCLGSAREQIQKMLEQIEDGETPTDIPNNMTKQLQGMDFYKFKVGQEQINKWLIEQEAKLEIKEMMERKVKSCQ